MKEGILFILILFSTIFKSQNAKSIVSMYCSCDPVTTSNVYDGNKIYYIKNDADNSWEVKLSYNVIEKRNGQWTRILKNFFDFSKLEQTNQIENFISDFAGASADENFPIAEKVIVDNKEFFYSNIELYMQGTAYNGLNNYIFVFQDVNFEFKPIIISYMRVNGEFSGKFNFENSKVNLYNNFINETNKFITSKFGESDDNIDSPKNYHLKWRNQNSNIFDNLENNDYAYINFVKFDGENFYQNIKSEYEVEEVETNYYKIITGFVSPTIVYDKLSDKSLVVFIPNGWPNGAMWGYRSFYPKSLIGNSAVIESHDEILTIDLKNEISDGYISRIKKE